MNRSYECVCCFERDCFGCHAGENWAPVDCFGEPLDQEEDEDDDDE